MGSESKATEKDICELCNSPKADCKMYVHRPLEASVCLVGKSNTIPVFWNY